MRVRSLHVHPVKATAPIDVTAAEVGLEGLRHDRRWAVVDQQGHRLNAGRHDVLMTVRAEPTPDGLELSSPGLAPVRVAEPVGGPRLDVDISRMPTAVDAGEAAAAFFTALLGLPASLVWQDDPAARSVSTAHGGREDEPLNLADAGPLLLTTTESLARLNASIAETGEPADLSMQRFRPNVVVDGVAEAFAEDAWQTFRIGTVSFRFAEHCDRCSTTLIDPTTLEHGKEPIRTLARHRRWDGRTWFGIRIVPLTTGTIALGDAVVVG